MSKKIKESKNKTKEFIIRIHLIDNNKIYNSVLIAAKELNIQLEDLNSLFYGKNTKYLIESITIDGQVKTYHLKKTSINEQAQLNKKIIIISNMNLRFETYSDFYNQFHVVLNIIIKGNSDKFKLISIKNNEYTIERLMPHYVFNMTTKTVSRSEIEAEKLLNKTAITGRIVRNCLSGKRITAYGCCFKSYRRRNQSL